MRYASLWQRFLVASALLIGALASAQTGPSLESQMESLTRHGYFSSVSISGATVTAVAGAQLQYVPSSESRLALCAKVLAYAQARDPSVSAARLVSGAGELLVQCR